MPSGEGPYLVPTAAEEDRFWALIEAAWAGRGPQVNQARQQMSARLPTTEDYPGIVERAIDAMLAELSASCRAFGSERLQRRLPVRPGLHRGDGSLLLPCGAGRPPVRGADRRLPGGAVPL